MASIAQSEHVTIWKVTSDYTSDNYFDEQDLALLWISDTTDYAQKTHNGFTPSFDLTALVVWTRDESENPPKVQS